MMPVQFFTTKRTKITKVWNPITELLLRVAVGGLFIYAGAIKLADPAAFAVDIRHYRILPHLPVVALAVYLPWLEILAGVCVVSGKQFRGALLLLGAMMVAFTGALISAWVRGLDISCGCFGIANATANYPGWLMRDALIIACIVFLAKIGSEITPDVVRGNPGSG